MTIKVVDNKKLDMTEDEWNMYQKIVKSYTTATNKGEDLFIDLFETDQEGIIIFLKPPSRRQSTLRSILVSNGFDATSASSPDACASGRYRQSTQEKEDWRINYFVEKKFAIFNIMEGRQT